MLFQGLGDVSSDSDKDLEMKETRKMVQQQNRKKKKSGGFQSMGNADFSQ